MAGSVDCIARQVRFDIPICSDVVSASDDIVEPDLSRRLLRDLREIRQAKARKGIETVGETHVQMDNIGMMEINEIGFINERADRMKLLNVAKLDRDDAGELESNDQFE